MELLLHQCGQVVDSLAQIRVPTGYVHFVGSGEIAQHVRSICSSTLHTRCNVLQRSGTVTSTNAAGETEASFLLIPVKISLSQR